MRELYELKVLPENSDEEKIYFLTARRGRLEAYEFLPGCEIFVRIEDEELENGGSKLFEDIGSASLRKLGKEEAGGILTLLT